MINKEELLKISKDTHITNKEFLEKLYYQDVLLYDLSRSTLDLVFKGGTALYKFYGLPRFSEDLDFSCTDTTIIKPIITNIFSKRNISLGSENSIYDSYLVRGLFNGVLTKENNIRLDFAKSKVYSTEIKHYRSQFSELPEFMIKIMSLEEIFIEKISALLNRNKLRDFFDVYYLCRASKFNSELWITKFDTYSFSLNYLESRLPMIKKEWKKLNTYVLMDLPDFDLIYSFVLDKLKSFNKELKEYKLKTKTNDKVKKTKLSIKNKS